MEVQQMWDEYWKEPTVENKNKLILHYLGLVKSVAVRMLPVYRGRVDYDDLLSNGIIGLIDAIDRYDGTKGVRFESYAQKRIRGQILDDMRRQDWISSSMRMRINHVRNAYDALCTKLGREPSDEEIAQWAGYTTEQVRKAREDEYTYNVIYFERMAAGGSEDGYSLADMVPDSSEYSDPEKNIEKRDMAEILANALDKLSDREKKVIALYYKEELLLREIAQILEVTESRISQIHAKALGKLRQEIEKQLI